MAGREWCPNGAGRELSKPGWERRVSPLREYELVVIVRPDTAEERTGAAIERIQQFVSTRGGEVKEVDNWGRRKLAYPISTFLEGDYLVARVSIAPKDTRELESNLEISEDILRHLLVRLDG